MMINNSSPDAKRPDTVAGGVDTAVYIRALSDWLLLALSDWLQLALSDWLLL